MTKNINVVIHSNVDSRRYKGKKMCHRVSAWNMFGLEYEIIKLTFTWTHNLKIKFFRILSSMKTYVFTQGKVWWFNLCTGHRPWGSRVSVRDRPRGSRMHIRSGPGCTRVRWRLRARLRGHADHSSSRRKIL